MAISAPEVSGNPLRALLAQESKLAPFYGQWQESYLARGGDRNVEIAVSWTDSLSTERSKARGRVRLDLIGGIVRAEVRGLQGLAADLWLVDNLEGPGRTVKPEPGDRMVLAGALEERGTVSAELGPGFFRDFELDLVVVSSRSSATPPP